MTPRLRRVWFQAHTWLALSLGWLLALNALLGALLTVAKPLDQGFNAHLFVQSDPAAEQPPVSLESLRTRLTAEFAPEPISRCARRVSRVKACAPMSPVPGRHRLLRRHGPRARPPR